jgi:hypothetical protein
MFIMGASANDCLHPTFALLLPTFFAAKHASNGFALYSCSFSYLDDIGEYPLPDEDM